MSTGYSKNWSVTPHLEVEENEWASKFVDPEVVVKELDGCGSKRILKWVLEKMEEDCDNMDFR